MEEESWEEASKQASKQASGRHLGGILEAREDLEAKVVQNRVFLMKVDPATILRTRDEPNPHQVPRLRTKVSCDFGRGTCTTGHPPKHARTPTVRALFGE